MWTFIPRQKKRQIDHVSHEACNNFLSLSLLNVNVNNLATAADPQGQPYRTAFKRALDEPQEFWGEIAEDIVWTKKWERVLDDSKSPFTKWFPGGELSVCYNAVDRHVDEGRGGNKALIWDSAITGNKKTWTYQELLKEVRSG